MTKKNLSVATVRVHEVGSSEHGQRIDNFLIKHLKNLPRSRLYRSIRKGEVRVNKKRVKPEYKLQSGDLVRIPPLRSDSDRPGPILIPEELSDRIKQAILFENEHIAIVNKPSGLAVHSGSGLRYGLIDVMRGLIAGDTIELVHRLDRDTSGCVLLAKNRPALLTMQRLLQTNEIRKFYQAIVRGEWPKSLRKISMPLKPVSMPNGEKRVFVDEQGLPAETRVLQIEHRRQDGISYSELLIQLITGRTHQIRVHCQAQQHEISGDQKYGNREFNSLMKQLGCRRLMLHACRLEIPANAHTNALIVEAPEPGEFAQLKRHDG